MFEPADEDNNDDTFPEEDIVAAGGPTYGLRGGSRPKNLLGGNEKGEQSGDDEVMSTPELRVSARSWLSDDDGENEVKDRRSSTPMMQLPHQHENEIFQEPIRFPWEESRVTAKLRGSLGQEVVESQALWGGQDIKLPNPSVVDSIPSSQASSLSSLWDPPAVHTSPNFAPTLVLDSTSSFSSLTLSAGQSSSSVSNRTSHALPPISTSNLSFSSRSYTAITRQRSPLSEARFLSPSVTSSRKLSASGCTPHQLLAHSTPPTIKSSSFSTLSSCQSPRFSSSIITSPFQSTLSSSCAQQCSSSSSFSLFSSSLGLPSTSCFSATSLPSSSSNFSSSSCCYSCSSSSSFSYFHTSSFTCSSSSSNTSSHLARSSSRYYLDSIVGERSRHGELQYRVQLRQPAGKVRLAWITASKVSDDHPAIKAYRNVASRGPSCSKSTSRSSEVATVPSHDSQHSADFSNDFILPKRFDFSSLDSVTVPQCLPEPASPTLASSSGASKCSNTTSLSININSKFLSNISKSSISHLQSTMSDKSIVSHSPEQPSRRLSPPFIPTSQSVSEIDSLYNFSSSVIDSPLKSIVKFESPLRRGPRILQHNRNNSSNTSTSNTRTLPRSLYNNVSAIPSFSQLSQVCETVFSQDSVRAPFLPHQRAPSDRSVFCPDSQGGPRESIFETIVPVGTDYVLDTFYPLATSTSPASSSSSSALSESSNNSVAPPTTVASSASEATGNETPSNTTETLKPLLDTASTQNDSVALSLDMARTRADFVSISTGPSVAQLDSSSQNTIVEIIQSKMAPPVSLEDYVASSQINITQKRQLMLSADENASACEDFFSSLPSKPGEVSQMSTDNQLNQPEAVAEPKFIEPDDKPANSPCREAASQSHKADIQAADDLGQIMTQAKADPITLVQTVVAVPSSQDTAIQLETNEFPRSLSLTVDSPVLRSPVVIDQPNESPLQDVQMLEDARESEANLDESDSDANQEAISDGSDCEFISLDSTSSLDFHPVGNRETVSVPVQAEPVNSEAESKVTTNASDISTACNTSTASTTLHPSVSSSSVSAVSHFSRLVIPPITWNSCSNLHSTIAVQKLGTLPPSTEDLIQSFPAYGLLEVEHKEPHYSEEALPFRPKPVEPRAVSDFASSFYSSVPPLCSSALSSLSSSFSSNSSCCSCSSSSVYPRPLASSSSLLSLAEYDAWPSAHRKTWVLAPARDPPDPDLMRKELGLDTKHSVVNAKAKRKRSPSKDVEEDDWCPSPKYDERHVATRPPQKRKATNEKDDGGEEGSWKPPSPKYTEQHLSFRTSKKLKPRTDSIRPPAFSPSRISASLSASSSVASPSPSSSISQSTLPYPHTPTSSAIVPNKSHAVTPESAASRLSAPSPNFKSPNGQLVQAKFGEILSEPAAVITQDVLRIPPPPASSHETNLHSRQQLRILSVEVHACGREVVLFFVNCSFIFL